MHTKSFSSPFRYWIISDFFKDTALLRQTLLKEKFNRKEADLYQFYHSQDVSLTKNKILKKFYDTFSSSSFLKKISFLTKQKLASIDMTPFLYADTDYLLPHDDRLEGRKIAYVFYLNTLKKSQGGSLDFFKGEKIIKRLFPKEGTLVLFEVSPQSVHQVSEVVNTERITLAGWFHG